MTDSDFSFGNDQRRWTNYDTVTLLVLIVSAVALRSWYLFSLKQTVFFDNLLVNASLYDEWATNGYPRDEPFYQAPLYIYFLQAIYEVVGSDNRLIAVRIVQGFLGTTTAILVYLEARRWLGTLAGAIAGFTCAMAGTLVYFEGELLPTSLATFLLTASLVLMLRLGPVARRRSARAWLWVVPGFVLGIAVTCRPNFLVFAPFFAFLVLRQSTHAPGSPRPGRRAWVGAAACASYIVAVLLPVSLVTLRNHRAGQGFVLLTSNWGPNLLLAHHPGADGLNPFVPDEIARMRRDVLAGGATQVELSRLSRQAAFEFMREHPRATAALWFKKALLFYNRYEIPNNRSIREQVSKSAALRLPPAGWVGLGILFPLALAGLVAAWRLSELRSPLFVLFAGAPLSFMPFIICARFRAPFVPMLAILAAAAVARLLQRPLHREGLTTVCMIAIGVVISWPNWYGVRSAVFPQLATNHAKLYQQLAESAARKGDVQGANELLREARRVLEQAAQEHPNDPLPRSNLGGLMAQQADFPAARRYYEQALSLDPRHAKSLQGLAWVAVQQSNLADAEDLLRRAIVVDSQSSEYAQMLADVLFARSEFSESIAMYERYIDLATPAGAGDLSFGAPAHQKRYARAQIYVARARLAEREGDVALAESHLHAAIQLFPNNVGYRVELGLLHYRSGRHDAAIEVLRESLERGGLSATERDRLQRMIREIENQM